MEEIETLIEHISFVIYDYDGINITMDKNRCGSDPAYVVSISKPMGIIVSEEEGEAIMALIISTYSMLNNLSMFNNDDDPGMLNDDDDPGMLNDADPSMIFGFMLLIHHSLVTPEYVSRTIPMPSYVESNT